ncbi:MAG TPA: CBS domain-containing protein [Anaerolineales bacterium]|nr:CBS domain-containing protein [Anaerolineales bacterium]
MNIIQCMKRNVVSISETSTIREAATVFAKAHVGPLPVVDRENRPVGTVGLHDLLALELPDFVSFVADVDFVHHFGAVEVTHSSGTVLDQPITTLMKPPVMVDEETGLLRADTLLLQHKLHDIPVLSDDGQLVGIASTVGIGITILSARAKVR